MEDKRWTVQELAKSSCELLQRQGMESPRLDADLLLADALGVERLQLYVEFDRPVDADGRARFRESIKRRLKGEPVAYILGVKNFLESSFRVTPDVLIPRPETELLVETVVALMLARPEEARRFVEIGVGSGCVTISTLLQVPDATAIACDISTGALRVAEENVLSHGVADRVSLIESDLLQPSGGAPPIGLVGEGAPSVIVSNPPYITDDELPGLSVDVRDFEPRLALRSETPLEIHKRICLEASALLDAGGTVAFELPGKGEGELAQFVGEHWPGLRSSMRRDLAGLPRVFVASGTDLPTEIDRYFQPIGCV